MSRRSCYPRPDFARQTWMLLNGPWRFAFDDVGAFSRVNPIRPEQMPLTIEVPYVYQSRLSGIGDTARHSVVWYARAFSVPEGFVDHTYLVFGAVDWHSDLWVNGVYIGGHDGGYTPWRVDITDVLRPGEQEIILRVEDSDRCDQPRGKQSWEAVPTRCWYTPSTGIWQSVWIENAPRTCIDSFELRPDLAQACVHCRVSLSRRPAAPGELRTVISFGGQAVVSSSLALDERTASFSLPIRPTDAVDELHYWSPDRPNLYDVALTYSDANGTDRVTTYFGMREITVEDGRILLNQRPFYQRLLLHQGYYDGGLLTAESDDRYCEDLKLIKAMGFNGLRMHQKVEDPLLYYWADRLGLVVWGEMPSCYTFTADAMDSTFALMRAFIQRDCNHPSIICWVPFNESWGIRNVYASDAQQRYVIAMYHMIKAYDPGRLVSGNDGWEQVITDLCGIHDYAKDGEALAVNWDDPVALTQRAAQDRLIYARGYRYHGEPILLTEFGGIAYKIDCAETDWGYHEIEHTQEAFLKRLGSIMDYVYANPALQGYCYTQFTDVMQETNGLTDIARNPKAAIKAYRQLFGR